MAEEKGHDPVYDAMEHARKIESAMLEGRYFEAAVGIESLPEGVARQPLYAGLAIHLARELPPTRDRKSGYDQLGYDPKDLFSAIYLSFLGKESGPKAGWFLSVLDRKFLEKRLEEVIR